MTYVIIVGLFIMRTSLISAQPIEISDPNWPCDSSRVSIDALKFDFGRVPQWQEVEQIFFLSNFSDVPVTVKGITTSCACTAAQLPDKTIAPGDSLVIRLTFSSKSRFGLSLTNATITFTDPNICPIRMLLEATVFSDGPRFSPKRIDFNRVPFQTKAHQSVRIVNLGDPLRQWDILSLKPSSRLIKAQYLEHLGQIEITFTNNHPPGNIEESVTVSIGQTDQDLYEITLPITGKVRGPLYAQPNQIFVSAIQTDRKVSRNITLHFAPGISDLEIISTDLPPEISEIKQTARTNNLREYQLTIKPPLVPGLHKSKLIFHTNHPVHPILTVPVLVFTQK